ncbi:MAG: DUF2470 domain-containing protein [Actinomycetota bacterium]
MADDFSADEKAQMIEHMNDDHGDACLLYARHHLGIDSARSATMTGITRTTMTLDVTMQNGSRQTATYSFERPLTSVGDAAVFLAKMVGDVDGE